MVGVLAKLLYALLPGTASQVLPGMAGIGYAASSSGAPVGESFGPIGRALAYGSQGMHGMNDFLLLGAGVPNGGNGMAGIGDFYETGAPTSSMGAEQF